MSIDEFEHIIKQIKDISSYIYLHVQGEPLLHPYFDQILTICDNYEYLSASFFKKDKFFFAFYRLSVNRS